MLFNVDKWKVMHFSKKNQQHAHYMNVHKLDCYWRKRLGIWFSHDLKASQQCIQTYSKATRLLGVLNRTIKCKDVWNLVCFYKSLIRPHLEFCTPAWSPQYMKDKILIKRIQRRLRKIFPCFKNTVSLMRNS